MSLLRHNARQSKHKHFACDSSNLAKTINPASACLSNVIRESAREIVMEVCCQSNSRPRTLNVFLPDHQDLDNSYAPDYSKNTWYERPSANQLTIADGTKNNTTMSRLRTRDTKVGTDAGTRTSDMLEQRLVSPSKAPCTFPLGTP